MKRSLPIIACMVFFGCNEKASTSGGLDDHLIVDTANSVEIQTTTDSVLHDHLKAVYQSSTRDSLLIILKEVVLNQHPDADSVTIFQTAYENAFCLEVFLKNENTGLYLAKLLSPDIPQATVTLVGFSNGNIASLKTPGDIFYHVMRLSRENDTIGLRKMIPPSGYRIDISDGVYDDESFEEHRTIWPEAINFDSLHFTFDLKDVNFNFELMIDSTFDDYGYASFRYFGGGFYERVLVLQTGKSVFLKGYSFDGH